MMRNPDANIDDMPIDELTKMTREYLDKEFMLEFIDKGANALRNSREVSFEKKRELLPKIDKAIEFFNIELIEESEAKTVVKDLAKDVVFAIDKLEIIKNSTEYTFTSSINMAVAKFFAAIKNNPKEQARFDKQTAKRDKLVAAGKDPDWKVVPASLIDLDVQREEIIHILENLKANYERQLAVKDFDYQTAMVAIIDYLKEQASTFVYKVTPKIAKAKALKLMEEVGIPEARIRFNQYRAV